MSGPPHRDVASAIDEDIDRYRLHTRLGTAVAALQPAPSTPAVVVDLDAFDANAADLVRRAGGKSVRIATKSLRVPALIARALALPGFHGALSYDLREAIWLVENDLCDDVVMGYPSVDRPALARLASSPGLAESITLMVDDLAHLDMLDALGPATTELRLALDIDASLRVPGAHVGPQRSPLFTAAALARMVAEIEARPGMRLVGVMTYEGQIAGLPDDVPTARARSLVVRRIKAASVRQLTNRRTALAGVLPRLEFWNAGGSGSIEVSAGDPVVTEVSAGSGLLAPGLFDHYRSFSPRPAVFFGLPVVRRPAPACVTVAGGGLVASGPAGGDRLPQPWAPPGLSLTRLEGAGEVQTPLVGTPASWLHIGDLVWFRHAKSGELMEHVDGVHLVSGRSVVETVPTYRGTGNAW